MSRSDLTASPRSRVTSAPRVRTVGVEEELLLVDAATLQPVPVADRIVGHAFTGGTGGGIFLELEAKREQIEVVSPPLRTFDELHSTIVAGRRAADEAARSVGARAVALATAPPLCASHRANVPRYERMEEQFALTMQEQLTCGFHVHVGVDSAEEGVAVLDRLRPWLPVLLALSANSPFWQGVDTGFASYRYQAWGRWPTAGAYDLFGSVDAYAATVQQLIAADVCLDPGMVYFDARLSSHVPTVEIRIADVCQFPEDAAAIASLCRALVQKAAVDWRSGVPADEIPTGLLRLASWRASRFGLDHKLVHPVTRQLVPSHDAVHALVDHLAGSYPDQAEEDRTRLAVTDILRCGNGATQQRRAMSADGNTDDIIADALVRTQYPDADLP
jgi:carboxylate-amine ligase